MFKNVSCLLKDYRVFSIVDVESEFDRLRIIKRVPVCGECYERLAESRYRS